MCRNHDLLEMAAIESLPLRQFTQAQILRVIAVTTDAWKLLTRRNRSSILDEACTELAPTAISDYEYSAMPINNSGDQLLVRRISGEAICELSKREPVIVFNKSLKDRVENTIWIKGRLHSTLFGVRQHQPTGHWFRNAPKDENPRLMESWDTSPKQPSPKCCSIPSLR